MLLMFIKIEAEFVRILIMFPYKTLLALAKLIEMAAAFAETAALMLDMLVWITPEFELMLIMFTEAILSRTVMSPSLSAILRSRELMSSS